MKILNAKLTKRGKEYRATVAVYKNMPVTEFLELLRSTLPLQEAQVVGFRDSDGVLLSPSLLLNDPDQLKSEEYELVLRDKTGRPTSGSLRTAEDPIPHILADLREKAALSEEDYIALVDMVMQKDDNIQSALRAYSVDLDLDALRSRLLYLRLSSPKLSRRHSGEPPRPVSQRNAEHSPVERPTTTRSSDRPERPGSISRGIRRNYDRYMQVIAELESQDILEERLFSVIKTLILRENTEVLREIDTYLVQGMSLVELGHSLMRISDAQGSSLQRPSSPMPRKNELLLLVNSIVKAHLPSEQDIELLNTLIAQENEFVFSAFDVFESDKDQEELLDSLLRAVAKYRKQQPEERKARPNPAQLLTDLNLGEHLSPEQQGTLNALVRSQSRALAAQLERFHETDDLGNLIESVKLLTSYYFQHLMDTNFSRREARYIRRQLKEGGDFAAALQAFEVDGQINNFVSTLKQILQRVGFAPTSASDYWQLVLDDLEAEEDSEEELPEPLQALTLLVSRSEQLKPYQGYLTNQLAQGQADIMDVARRFGLTENLDDCEKRLMKLVRLIPSHKPSTAGDSDSSQEENLLLETIRTQLSDEKVAKFQKLYRDGLEALLGAIEVFKATGDEADLLETLHVIDNYYEESECSDEHAESGPAAFQDFVCAHFSEEEQTILLRLQAEGDQRIAAAIDMHDFAAEARELVETLKFIIKSQEDLKTL